MKKSVYTREQIERLYEEVMERFRNEVDIDAFSTIIEINDFKRQLCQVIYSFLLATSANYPDCIRWCIEMERKFL